MKTIPKIIHQTWKEAELPLHLKELAKTWKQHFPDWQYILWTDRMNRDFVKNNFPKFLKMYDSYPKNIQRADAIRYLLLKKYGGIYVDLDFECLENFEFLLEDKDFIAGKEPQFNADRFNKEYVICNAFMASTPDNPFINHVCDKLMNCPSVEVHSPSDVLNSTGPFMLTDAYNEFESKGIIRILESKDIYPINLFEKEQIIKGQISEEMADRINRAYAIHYFYSNW